MRLGCYVWERQSRAASGTRTDIGPEAPGPGGGGRRTGVPCVQFLLAFQIIANEPDAPFSKATAAPSAGGKRRGRPKKEEKEEKASQESSEEEEEEDQ
ncbi:unnamed protein product [Menidia menidia]|uniref:(Atlantic silverside) hypothetical protein n=1 Tax=Menidia menidia TaxID=238744 RepID=A0A8S4C0C4_9TELE|nr:unnamed protein product [Menidia menidia]